MLTARSCSRLSATVRLSSMGNVTEKRPFRCPICDHDEFERVLVRDRPTEAWQCGSCSVVFKDYDRFTKHRLGIPKSYERPIKKIEDAYQWPSGAKRKRR